MNIVLSVTYTGSPDTDDVLAAQRLVRLENERRAALTPPGTPLDIVGAALKTSTLLLLTERITSAWQSYVSQGRAETVRFTPAQVDQIMANLNARLNAGETAAAIVTDTTA